MAKRLDSIQILRAFAAISVVGVHSIERAAHTFPLQAPSSFLNNFHHLNKVGGVGVDIFFVISGFVMMYVHYEQFGDRKAPLNFISRRLIRVVPLYWSLTIAGIVLLAVAPKLFFYHSYVDIPWVIGSFLFIQIAPHSGAVEPVIGQGWTLEFEMFFYAMFAVALLMPRRRAVTLLTATFLTLLAVGAAFPGRPSWIFVWTGPLLIEFLVGVALAIAYRNGIHIFSEKLGRILIAIGFALIIASVWNTPPTKGWMRPVEWGIPATLVVWGALSVKVNDGLLASIGKLLGDASYSIYLFQAFALPGLALALKAAVRGYPISVDLAACILMVTAIPVSVGCWYLFERPMTRFLNARFLKPEPRKLPPVPSAPVHPR